MKKMALLDNPLIRLCRRSLVLVLTGLVLLATPAFCDKAGKKKKAKNDPANLLAKAETLYEQGKYEKAVRTFQLASDNSESGCLECLRGMFRASAARGRFEEAVQYSGAALDMAAVLAEAEAESDSGEDPETEDDTEAEDDPEAEPAPEPISEQELAEEITTVFKQALATTQGSDPDVIWGLFDVLSRQGQYSEIVRLAQRHLDTTEEKSLICAADSRRSLAKLELLSAAEEINKQLRGLDWDGPLLVSSDMRRPKLRNGAYPEGQGAQMSGVVDSRGFLHDVRLVRPPPGKITMPVRDKIRRALYDPATYRGRRTKVCYPFSVTLPGQINLAQQGGGSKDGAGAQGPASALYYVIQGFESATPILELVERVGDQATLPQRASLCAAIPAVQDELNQGLLQLEWPGPYLDTEAVQDPTPKHRQGVDYTDEARAAGIEGKVVLSVVISEGGKVVNVEVLEELGEGLTDQARLGVSAWTFEPAELGGKKVAVCRKIVVPFKLE